MRNMIRKIHMYVGLVSFTCLVVYGIAGLSATFDGPPEERRREGVVRYEPFAAPPEAGDRQVAELVYAKFRYPLSGPVPPWAFQRDPANNLVLNFYSLNGIQSVTVLEKEGRLRIETRRNGLARYLNNAHGAGAGARPPDPRLRLWGIYNEIAMFSLTVLALSGVYLWLSSRPRYVPALASLALGGGIFLALYYFTR